MSEKFKKIISVGLGAALVISLFSSSPRYDLPQPLGVETAEAAPIHTPHDNIPDFCENPTKTSTGSGSWSNASTWSPSGVPSTNDVVMINSGHTITFDANSTPSLNCVGIKGTLNFRTSASSQLTAGTVMVYASGTLTMGTVSSPMPNNVTAEIVIANRALNLSFDPDQYGTGLLAWGKVSMHGNARTPTFSRLAAEPLAGQNVLNLTQNPSGWRVGDRIVVPDTRQLRYEEFAQHSNFNIFVSQAEERTITAISGSQVTLNSALSYNHRGARNTLTNALEFLPHVGNFTRNVIVRSEAPSGTRGHVMFTDRADIDVRYSQFKDLGRTTIDELNHVTNHIGRYALHIHHLYGPTSTPSNGYQYTLIGNSVENGGGYSRQKWGITVHGSHYGMISDNVIFNIGGAAIMTEDGNESYNVFERNFIVHRGQGTGGRMGQGRESVGIYLRGPLNYVRDNVVTNVLSDGADSGYGYKYFFHYLGDIKVPNFKGASTADGSGQYTVRNPRRVSITEFNNNETYGAMESGMTYWWIGTYESDPDLNAPESFIRNLKVWNASNKAIFHYAAHRLTIENLVVRGAGSIGIDFADYFGRDITIRNADIQAGMNGIGGSPVNGGSGTITIENSNIVAQVGIQLQTPWSVGYGVGGIFPHRYVIKNTKITEKDIGQPYGNGVFRMVGGGEGMTLPDKFYVYDHNQVPGDNFQLFYSQQAPNFIVPAITYGSDGTQLTMGAPDGTHTNQYWQNLYPDGRYTIGGMVAPCTTTRPGFQNAFVCPLSGSTPPAPVPPPPPGPTPLPPPPAPVPTPTPAPASCDTASTNSFTGCYFEGAAFQTHKLTRTDNAIDFNWGTGTPDPSVPPDNFSARWIGNFMFDAGTYDFSATTDDGVKVYVDDNLIINQWVNQPATTITGNRTMTAGSHTVKMEYFEGAGDAVARLSWTKRAVTPPPPPPPANQPPVGNFDEINSSGVVRGWSYDPDASSSSNQVHIYIDGPAGQGGTLLNGAATNILRSDVNATFGISGNHGFEYSIPAQYRNGQNHSIYVYGVDTSDSAVATHLAASPRTFNIAPPVVLPTLTLSATDATAAEPSNNGIFTFTRTGATTASLAVGYTISGTATNGSDYNTIGTSVTIPAGSATATVPVTVINDSAVESDEQVTLAINSSASYTIGTPNAASVTITSDDTTPTPTPVPPPPPPTGNTYNAEADFSGTQGQRNWTYRDSAGNLMTYNSAEGYWFGNEQYNLIWPSGGHPGENADSVRRWTAPGSGSINITGSASDLNTGNGDGVNLYIRKGQTALWQHALDNGGADVNYNLTTTVVSGDVIDFVINKRASNGQDTTYFNPTIAFTPGVTPPPPGPVPPPPPPAPTLPTVTVSATDASAGEPSNNGTFTFTRTGSTTASLAVSYAVSGTATNGSDYNTISTSVTIPAGSATATVPVTVINDSAVESSEQVTLAINLSASYTIGTSNAATVTITSDDSSSTPPPPPPPAPTPTPGTGLIGSYYHERNLSKLSFTRTDATVNFDWGLGSPDLRKIYPSTFSVRWTGQVMPKYTETYTFYTNTDDGARLWVNDQLIINSWIDQGLTEKSGTITLQAGQKYNIKMEYYEKFGSAVARLSWSSPSQTKQVIPKEQLYPSAVQGTQIYGPGTLIKLPSQATVYLILPDNKLLAFASEQHFHSYGYLFSQVIEVDSLTGYQIVL